MAGIWAQQKDEEVPWGVASLEGLGEAFYLTGDPKRPVTARKDDVPHGQSPYIIRHEEPDGRERWSLWSRFNCCASSRKRSATSGNTLLPAGCR